MSALVIFFLVIFYHFYRLDFSSNTTRTKCTTSTVNKYKIFLSFSFVRVGLLQYTADKDGRRQIIGQKYKTVTRKNDFNW